MTRSQERPTTGERAYRLHSVAKRSLEVGRERGMVEEVVGRLREDERRLSLDLSALQAERREREKELAEVRGRVGSLDTSLTVRQLGLRAKERELDLARNELERKRELVRRVEQEILDYRRQIAASQAQLTDLIERAVRIRQRVWRVASRGPRSP
jgi:chromosome segregation ATPase